MWRASLLTLFLLLAHCKTAVTGNASYPRTISMGDASAFRRVGAGECCTPSGNGPYAVVDSSESLALCENSCTAAAGCLAVTYKGSFDTSPNVCHALHFASGSACSQFCLSRACAVNHCQDQTPAQVAHYTKSNCRTTDPSTWSCFALDSTSSCVASGSLDLRVSKAMGPRGYDAVRISVVSEGSPVSSEIFPYQQQFHHRWDQFALSSGVVTASPGSVTKVEIGDNTACIRVPALGEGVRGIMFGDPCIVGGTCNFVEQFNVKDVLTQVLNKASSTATGQNNPIDFWAILGDNFYDQKASSDRTPAFFGSLSQDAKSTIMMAVPGNHDFWVNGAPDNGNVLCDDQFGNGFMQYYGQDSLAASSDLTTPFNFSVRPPPASSADCKYDQGWTASEDNFFFYHVIGNVGFVGYSGHTAYAFQRNSFAQACSYFASLESELTEVVLLGHWSEGGHGGAGEDVGQVQDKVRQDFPGGCGKIKAFFGHQHCNLINGVQAAAYKSGDGKCNPSLAGSACFQHGATGYGGNRDCGSDSNHWGVLYFDTTSASGFLDLWYYPLGETVGGIVTDISAKLLDCIASHSLGDDECKQFGMQWLSPSSPV